MAPTSTRKGIELLKDAGSDKEELGFLRISDRESFGMIYLTNGPLKPYVVKFFNLLATDHAGKWIRQAVNSKDNTISTSISSLPKPISRPRVQIGPALAEIKEIIPASTGSSETMPSKSMLAYVCVIQGNGGASCSKVVWRHNRIEIARAMFEEVINGYAVVFSGVMLMKDHQRLRNCQPNQQFSFQTAGRFAALLKLEKANALTNQEADLYGAWLKTSTTTLVRLRGEGKLDWKYGMNKDFKLGLFC